MSSFTSYLPGSDIEVEVYYYVKWDGYEYTASLDYVELDGAELPSNLFRWKDVTKPNDLVKTAVPQSLEDYFMEEVSAKSDDLISGHDDSEKVRAAEFRRT